MIKSKQEVETIAWDREIVSIVLIIIAVSYILNLAANAVALWWIIINITLLGSTIYYFKAGATSKQMRLHFLKSALKLARAYLIGVSVLAIVIFLYPNIFSGVVEDEKILVIALLSIPNLGLPLYMLSGSVVEQVRNSNSSKRNALIAGTGNLALHVEQELRGCQVKGYIQCEEEESVVQRDKIVGEIGNIYEYLRVNPVDEIVIAVPVEPPKSVQHIINAADYHGIRVKYVPDYQNMFGSHSRTTRFGRMEAVNIRQMPLDNAIAALQKRCFDILFSISALLFLLPLFLVIALLIKLDSPGSVFYCPMRVGRGGKSFKVYKFRSMSVNDSTIGGTLSTFLNDPRVTRVGKYLRKYSLDELPQFLNVLLGDMSVVGPRPHRSVLNKELQESEEKYMIRHYFKPGITGWAQVNGWRGPTETKVQKQQRTLHDLWYMENWSMGLDLRIIFLTIFGKKVHKNAF